MGRHYTINRGTRSQQPQIAPQPRTKEFTARFGGRCANCRSRIRPGDWIIYHFVERKAYCVSCLSFVYDREEWLKREESQRVHTNNS